MAIFSKDINEEKLRSRLQYISGTYLEYSEFTKNRALCHQAERHEVSISNLRHAGNGSVELRPRHRRM